MLAWFTVLLTHSWIVLAHFIILQELGVADGIQLLAGGFVRWLIRDERINTQNALGKVDG